MHKPAISRVAVCPADFERFMSVLAGWTFMGVPIENIGIPVVVDENVPAGKVRATIFGREVDFPIGEPVALGPSPAEHRWLIWSHEHSAYWRANGFGYTSTDAFAGRYTEEAAREICRNAAYCWRDGPPPEVMVLADSPDLDEAVQQATDDAIAAKEAQP